MLNLKLTAMGGGLKPKNLLQTANILVVDDDKEIAEFIEKTLTYLGCCSFKICFSPIEALAFVENNPIDIILMDVVFKNNIQQGSDVIFEIQKKINVPVIYISGYPSEIILDQIKTTVSHGFLQKPFTAEQFKITLELALYNFLKESLRLSQEHNEQLLLKQEETEAKNRQILDDLERAKNSQQVLLPPHKFKTNLIQTDFVYEPMDLIGGDFLSYTRFKHDDAFGVFLWDVCGHGAAAALYTHSIKAIADRLPRKFLSSPQFFLEALNKEIIRFVNGSNQSNFITGLYGFFSKNSQGERLFSFSNAGVPYPIILRKRTNFIEQFKLNGAVLGCFEKMQFDKKTIILEPQDRIFLFTDGVTEAINPDKEQLELEGLMKIITIANDLNLNISETLQKIMQLIKDYRQYMPVNDDVVIFGAEIS